MSTASHSPVLYEHRQIGWIMLGAASVPLVCLSAILAVTEPAQRSLPWALLPILFGLTIVVLVGFASLSVIVTRDFVVARFGIGLVRKSIALDDVLRTRVTLTRWYEGWGIRWTRRGMLYNVAGFDAVELELRNGRTVRIGSDDAARLASTLTRAIGDRRTAAT